MTQGPASQSTMPQAAAWGMVWPPVAAAVFVALLLAFGGPVWQIHDDAYYAMIAQGWGIVPAASAEVPFMHPIVGQVAAWLSTALGLSGYVVVLYGLLWLGLTATLTAAGQTRQPLLPALLAGAAAAPLLLIPQYTSVAAYLAVAAVLLLLAKRAGRGPGPLAMTVAFLLLLASAAFRLEMMLLAVVVASPFLRQVLPPGDPVDRRIVAALAVAVLGAALAVGLSAGPMTSPGIAALNKAHVPRVPFVDYGLVQLLREPASGAAGVDLARIERELLSRWFFADPSLFPGDRLDALARTVSWTDRIKGARFGVAEHVRELTSLVYFWILVAVVPLAWAARKRQAIVASLCIFVGAEIVFAWMGRAFPERVGLGLAVGLFTLSAWQVVDGAHPPRWRWAPAVSAALVLVALVAMHLTYRTPPRQDVTALQEHLRQRAASVTYFVPAHLPLRALFKPLDPKPARISGLVGLGTMYDHPGARAHELAQGCAFVRCLETGRVIGVYASDQYVDMLSRYTLWKFGRTLRILKSQSVGPVRFHEISL